MLTVQGNFFRVELDIARSLVINMVINMQYDVFTGSAVGIGGNMPHV